MKKSKLLLVLGSILILSGCGGPVAKSTDADTKQPTAVTVQTAKKGTIMSSGTFSGRTKAATEIAVTAETSGNIEKVYVTIGQKVKKGDKLLSIKADDTNRAVKQALVDLESAKANYNSSVGGSVNNQLNQLESNVASAQTSYDNAKRNYDTYKELYKSNSISQDDLRKSELSFTQAQQSLDSAKKAYDTAKNQTIPESQASAKKQLEKAQVSYEVALSKLDKLTITAPTDGIVTTVNVNDDEIISQTSPAFVISNIDALESDLQVAEMDIDKFKAGDTVSVSLSAKTISGTVKDVSRVANSSTSLYTVKISMDNSQYNFPAGMAIDVQLNTQKSENVVTIPKKALFEESGKKYVYICSDNKAVKTEVETGLSDAYKAEIKQGVKIDDTVVIGGISNIKDGDGLFPVEKED